MVGSSSIGQCHQPRKGEEKNGRSKVPNWKVSLFFKVKNSNCPWIRVFGLAGATSRGKEKKTDIIKAGKWSTRFLLRHFRTTVFFPLLASYSRVTVECLTGRKTKIGRSKVIKSRNTLKNSNLFADPKNSGQSSRVPVCAYPTGKQNPDNLKCQNQSREKSHYAPALLDSKTWILD